MKKKNKMFEVKVTLMVPEDRESDGLEGLLEETFFETMDAVLAPPALKIIEGFMHLAENAMRDEETKRIVDALESLENIDDGKFALELLYSMFCASGMDSAAKAALDVIKFGDCFPDVYASVMEQFFDDDRIDCFLVSNRLEEAAGTQSISEEAENKEEAYGEM